VTTSPVKAEMHFSQFLLLGYFLVRPATGDCPIVGDNKYLWRLEDTHYFIFHKQTRGDYIDWEGARKLCEKYGLQMTKVDDLITMSVLGRALEKVVNKLELMDTWCKLNRSRNTSPGVSNFAILVLE